MSFKMPLVANEASPATENCYACAYSYMEPDSDLVCGHNDAGMLGTYARHAAAEGGHCGPRRPKFKQHPLRNADGSLKS